MRRGNATARYPRWLVVMGGKELRILARNSSGESLVWRPKRVRLQGLGLVGIYESESLLYPGAMWLEEVFLAQVAVGGVGEER